MIRGIGPATAQKLVNRFGAETLDIIEAEPERLQAVKGITDKRARWRNELVHQPKRVELRLAETEGLGRLHLDF